MEYGPCVVTWNFRCNSFSLKLSPEWNLHLHLHEIEVPFVSIPFLFSSLNLHRRIDLFDSIFLRQNRLHRCFSDSVEDQQRSSSFWLNCPKTIHHGSPHRCWIFEVPSPPVCVYITLSAYVLDWPRTDFRLLDFRGLSSELELLNRVPSLLARIDWWKKRSLSIFDVSETSRTPLYAIGNSTLCRGEFLNLFQKFNCS